MPSLTHVSGRHTVIDRRDGEYLAFPDILRAEDGRLIVAYNQADRHVAPTRRTLVLRESRDQGATWSAPRHMESPKSHCPRLAQLADGEIIIANAPRFFHFSGDNGDTWTMDEVRGLRHDMFDRINELADGTLVTTGHKHLGTLSHGAIRQKPTEQLVYASEDRGHSWSPVSAIARERNLVLCEGSMTLLPDGRLAALMRENSFVYESMYLCLSSDGGRSWTDPVPTPLIGHRPTLGVYDDRLLVTYRNVAPDPGTCAWLGTLDDLMGDFAVQGRHPDPDNPVLCADGLRIRNGEGGNGVVRYALRPMTDPRSATAVLEADIRVDTAGENGCGLRLGSWWRIFPDRIVVDGGDTVALEPGRFNTVRLEYARGVVGLFVNGERRGGIRVNPDHADTRPILVGAPYPFERNHADYTVRRLALRVDEPAMLREYHWEWTAQAGMPDRWAQAHILEIMNDREAAPPDFGYSGWTTLADGSIYCVYHHGGGTEPGYEPLETSRIMGTRIYPCDFDPAT